MLQIKVWYTTIFGLISFNSNIWTMLFLYVLYMDHGEDFLPGTYKL